MARSSVGIGRRDFFTRRMGRTGASSSGEKYWAISSGSSVMKPIAVGEEHKGSGSGLLDRTRMRGED